MTDLKSDLNINIQRSYNKPVQLQPAHMMKLWRERPKIFVKDAFDLTLDAWQEDAYDLYMNYQRIALVANKGPGKTFVIATMGWHFFITNHMPKIAALAISKDHLKSNMWAELAHLHAMSPLIKQSVEPGAERFSLKGHEQYSFISARSFPKMADSTQMANTLAGLHANNVAFLLDEAGMIPDAILATADNALSGGESNEMKKKIIAAGNPEVAKGMIYNAACGRSKQRWGVLRVTGDPDDPKRSPRVDINWAREQIATFGKDDPWVQVNVFGNYPKTAVDALLSQEEIAASMDRKVEEREVKNSQHRLGVDVARGGVDRTVFARRRGLKAYPLEAFPSDMYGPELAGKIAFIQHELQIERVFVDNTGGYGSSVIDSLQLFPALDVTPVVYNAKAQDARYFNKRSEMWIRMRDWIKKGGQLPNDPGLAEELMMPKLIFHGGVFRLEEKEQIKARLGRSPDKADALAQTFADVESHSFYADFGGAQAGSRDMTDEEFVENYNRRRNGNYISDQSHIDKYYRPAPNYKA